MQYVVCPKKHQSAPDYGDLPSLSGITPNIFLLNFFLPTFISTSTGLRYEHTKLFSSINRLSVHSVFQVKEERGYDWL